MQYVQRPVVVVVVGWTGEDPTVHTQTHYTYTSNIIYLVSPSK